MKKLSKDLTELLEATPFACDVLAEFESCHVNMTNIVTGEVCHVILANESHTGYSAFPVCNDSKTIMKVSMHYPKNVWKKSPKNKGA